MIIGECETMDNWKFLEKINYEFRRRIRKLNRYIYYEILFAILNIYYTVIEIVKGLFRGMVYLVIIYILLLIIKHFVLLRYSLEDVEKYINLQKPIELKDEILGFLNYNSGVIQTLSTTLLIIITAWYANITHKMLNLEHKRYSLEKEKRHEEREENYKKQKKETEEKPDEEIISRRGIRKR